MLGADLLEQLVDDAVAEITDSLDMVATTKVADRCRRVHRPHHATIRRLPYRNGSRIQINGGELEDALERRESVLYILIVLLLTYGHDPRRADSARDLAREGFAFERVGRGHCAPFARRFHCDALT